MGLVRIENPKVFRFLERLFRKINGVEFIPRGERLESAKFVGKNEEFTMADAEAIITILGYKKTPVYLRNTMHRGGIGSWVNFAQRLNEAGSIKYLAWEVRFLSEQVAQAVFEYGLCRGLLHIQEEKRQCFLVIVSE